MYTPEVQAYFSKSNRDITNVVLWGIESHVCITQTAMDFLQNKYSVFVLSDGVSSMNSGEIPTALQVGEFLWLYFMSSSGFPNELNFDEYFHGMKLSC
jgi:nicotinamidase-related amidase